MRKWLSILFTIALFCCTTKEIEFYTAEEREQIMNAGFSSSSAVSSSSSEALSSSSESSSDSSSSEADGNSSGSEGVSSSGQTQSSSSAPAVPDPINIGDPLSFINPDYTDEDGNVYYFLNSTPLVNENWVIGNSEALCGVIAYSKNLSTANTGKISVIARAMCNGVERELDRIEATVVPNHKLSGECAWTGTIPGGVFIEDNYGRCGDVGYFDGTTPWSAATGVYENVKAKATCTGGNLEANCPAIAICGTSTYDPSTHFCHLEYTYEKEFYGLCQGAPYEIMRQHQGSSKPQFCDGRDGLKYVYVTIGGRDWMAENLNYSGNSAVGKCGNSGSLVDYNTATCNTYGRLYTWDVALNACPDGWHLPSDAEWKSLMAAHGGTGTNNNVGAAAQMKTQNGWHDCGWFGNLYSCRNNNGFSALPGGFSSTGSNFTGVNEHALWWSRDATSSDASAIRIYHNNADVELTAFSKSLLLSVRCVRDN